MRHPVSQYAIRVCIRYKHIRDTIKACNRKQQAWGPYVHGQIEPHFSVPAIRIGVYVDDTMVYISDGQHLETFYKEGEWHETERG